MGETLDPQGPRGPVGGGLARLATLATGASALVVAGWCGAFVNRSLGAGLSAPPAPSVVLAPLSRSTATVAGGTRPVPGGTATAAASLAAPSRTGVPASSGVLSAAALPAVHGTAIELPLPVRAVRLTPATPSTAASAPSPTAVAPRLAGATTTAPAQDEGAPPAGPSDGSGFPVGPMLAVRSELTHHRAVPSASAQGRAAGPGRPAGDHRGAGDGDIDRG